MLEEDSDDSTEVNDAKEKITPDAGPEEVVETNKSGEGFHTEKSVKGSWYFFPTLVAAPSLRMLMRNITSFKLNQKMRNTALQTHLYGKGFSTVEILVVVCIIGVLLFTAIKQYQIYKS